MFKPPTARRGGGFTSLALLTARGRGLIAMWLFVFLLTVSPTRAQDLDFEIGLTQICTEDFRGKPEVAECIGQSAEACMEATEAGGTTAGMVGCAKLELDYWNQRLEVAMQVALDEAQIWDDENKDLGSIPKLTDPLVDLQRHLAEFRDATCAYEAAFWGGGSGAGPASIFCHLRMTGEQALYPESQAEQR